SMWRDIQKSSLAVRQSMLVKDRSVHAALAGKDPGVLGSPALRRVDHERALAQRDPRKPARDETHRLAGKHVRAQVNMPRGEAAFDERRAGRQRKRGLRDV